MDLGGRQVVPDSSYAAQRDADGRTWVDARYPGPTRWPATLDKLHERAAATPGGEWIFDGYVSRREQEVRREAPAHPIGVGRRGARQSSDPGTQARMAIVNTAATGAGHENGQTQSTKGRLWCCSTITEPTGRSPTALPTFRAPQQARSRDISVEASRSSESRLHLHACDNPSSGGSSRSGSHGPTGYRQHPVLGLGLGGAQRASPMISMTSRCQPDQIRTISSSSASRHGSTAKTTAGLATCMALPRSLRHRPAGRRARWSPWRDQADAFADLADANGRIAMLHCSGDAAVDIGLSA